MNESIVSEEDRRMEIISGQIRVQAVLLSKYINIIFKIYYQMIIKI